MKYVYLKTVIIILYVMMLSGCSFKYHSNVLNEEQFNDKLMNYFVQKNIDELPPMLEYISSCKMLERSKTSKAPLMGFFAGIYHENEEMFNQLEEMELSDSVYGLLSASREFEEIAEDMLSKRDYILESPAALDNFWGYFFATGRDEVIQKLCYTADNSGDTIVKSAAKWSLDSNRNKFPSKIKKCSDYSN